MNGIFPYFFSVNALDVLKILSVEHKSFIVMNVFTRIGYSQLTICA